MSSKGAQLGACLDRVEAISEILGAYGIRTPKTVLATTAEDAARAALSIGGKVAVKLVSEKISHKSDVGGVILGIEGTAAASAFCTIAARLEALGLRDQMEGVTIQEMVPTGVELLVGATLDPAYGPMIGFGIGGVNVELWKDIVFRLAPLRDVDAEDMLKGIRAHALLNGFRGAPAVDRAAVLDTLLRVSQLVQDLPEILELDINPLVASPAGVVAVDARIKVV